jgi:superoxide dismutase
VLGDNGWVDIDTEMSKRWVGGTMRLIPGKEDTQSRDVPLDMFFKKIIGVRDRLRVLEQKINQHPTLTPEDKVELEGYITRSYGSLTTFNLLFAAKESQFKGQGKEE